MNPPRSPAARLRLGCVSYLNTLPLIEGLGKLRDVRLTLTAPSKLIDLLIADDVDLALVSLIDYQRSPDPLAMLPVGMIASDGPTMTVRLFSSRPIDQLTEVHADADSHTSIVLLRIILQERFGIRPRLTGFDVEGHRASLAAAADGAPAPWPEAVLLIGDKVVTDSPPASLFPHQLDLGAQWKELTGLPFVYATWMCRRDAAERPEIRTIADVLDRQRRHNRTRLPWIAAQRATLRGWPSPLAHDYLANLLEFRVTPAHRRSVDLFFDKARNLGLIPARRPSQWAEWPSD